MATGWVDWVLVVDVKGNGQSRNVGEAESMDLVTDRLWDKMAREKSQG